MRLWSIHPKYLDSKGLVALWRYEFNWLLSKLRERDPIKYRELLSVRRIECHPIFLAVEGEIEVWEKGKI